MGGGKAQQHRTSLGYVERVKRAGQGNAQHMRAPFGNAGPQAFVLIAQNQHGRQLHGFIKGIEA